MARCADNPWSARCAWLLVLLVTTTACPGGSAKEDAAPATTFAGATGAVAPCDDPEACGDAPLESSCEAPIPVFEGGHSSATVCPDDVAEQGLTVVELADTWAPRVLAGGAGGPVPYRATYVRLANEDFGDDAEWDRARSDRFLELYGIFPSLSVMRKRLLDDTRHACHDAIANNGLASLAHGVDTWKPVLEQRGELATAAVLERQLTAAMVPLGLERLQDFANVRGPHAAYYAKYRRITTRDAAIRNMKQHLRCEHLYDGPDDGLMDAAVIDGLQAFHRRHMLISWQLDDETKRTLMADSRELDLLTALRTLRERVVDATGLIEDGTAAGVAAEIVGRRIDSAVFLDDSRGQPLELGADDHVGRATDAAAKALGWTSPASLRAALEAGSLPDYVAIKLPPPPAYHSPHMDLRVVIDRGDVWYDFAFTNRGDRYVQPRRNKPSLVLYVEYEGRSIPLVRWPTTIGGWQPETVNGRTLVIYKESPAGPRVYRDIVAAPVWVPPRSTPTRDLLRPRGQGVWVPKYDSFGPHYASAYGIAMLIHHRVDQPPEGDAIFTDQAIRTHGSASYDSILDGFSHGCHRLHNHRATRLTSFFLAHRNHVVRGPLPLDFHRTLVYRQNRSTLHFDSRGYRYELTPPIEVDVLPGRVLGHHASPPAPRQLPGKLLKRYGSP